MNTRNTLIQTLLSPGVAAFVRRKAKQEAISVAAWVRRLIIRESMNAAGAPGLSFVVGTVCVCGFAVPRFDVAGAVVAVPHRRPLLERFGAAGDATLHATLFLLCPGCGRKYRHELTAKTLLSFRLVEDLDDAGAR